jgi:hypothetical protein
MLFDRTQQNFDEHQNVSSKKLQITEVLEKNYFKDLKNYFIK